MTTSAIPLVKSGLVATLTSLLPAPVFVSYGHPGTVRADDMVAVMNAHAAQNWVVMTPSRPHDETVTVDVVFSSYRDDTQQVVTERAFAMLALLETYARSDPSFGVAGGRLGLVHDYDLAELTDSSGHVAEIAVRVTVTVRIT